MENKLVKKYGLPTAITMVIGIIIGSGVFFKAEKVLTATSGNLGLGILAWGLGALIMIVCAYVFSLMANRYEKINGLIDYSEATIGRGYGFFMGWFMTTIYTPAMTSVLAWVSARYTCVLFGVSDITGGICLVISCFFLVADYAMNLLSPKLAGKFQISTTAIKLIPLIMMAVVGTIAGLFNGILVRNFTAGFITEVKGSPLLTAMVATSFAYEGWVLATSINSELRDSKKNLPLALVFGTMLVAVIYILYYIGLAGAVSNQVVMESGEAGARIAFSRLFSNIGGTALFVLVIISCLGTLNGLMMSATRNFYSMAIRNEGPRPDMFRTVDPVTNMPPNSGAMGVLLCAAWLLYFYGANLTKSWFGVFTFDSSEIPIVTIYALYIPIFIAFAVKNKDLGFFNRFFMPILGVIACAFICYACWVSHGQSIIYYLIVFAVIQAIGMLIYYRKGQNKEIQ
ncbi:MAG: APC family permease [Sphaerochaetaceae bacterium]